MRLNIKKADTADHNNTDASMPAKKRFSKKLTMFLFLVFALIIEVYIFNFRFWTSLNNEAVPINLPVNGASDDTSGYITLDLSNSDIIVKNIGFYYIPVDTSLPIGSTQIIEYSPKLPARIYVECIAADGSKTLYSENYAYSWDKICTLTIKNSDIRSIFFSYEDAHLTQLFFNVKYDFSFSVFRFCIIFLLMCFIYWLRSGSKLWNIRFFDENMQLCKKQITIHILLCIIITIYISSLLYSNPFFKTIPDLYYFYPELARSFANGHTYDNELPPPELLELSDPYDPLILLESNIDFKLDRLFYNGRYYTYFGPLPCVLFYLPYYLITGQDMPHAPIILFLLFLFLTMSSLALIEAYRRYQPDGSIAGFYTGFFSLIIVTPFTVMAICDTFPYYIPILMAVCLLMSGLFFFLKAANLTDKNKNANIFFALGSFSIALIASCRPNLLIYSLVLVPILLPYAALKKENLPRWVSFITPIIIVAVPVMLYNYARFGNPLDYGYAYQLTINGSQKHPTIKSFVTALWHYFLQPVIPTTEFPYVRFTDAELVSSESTLIQAVSGGVLLLYPLLLFGIAAFFTYPKTKKNAKEMHHVSRILIVVSMFCSLLSSLSGGYMNRYLMDFSTMFGISAILMIWEHTNRSSRKTGFIRNLLLILILISSFNSFTQLFGTDLIDHSSLTDMKCKYEQTAEFWR